MFRNWLVIFIILAFFSSTVFSEQLQLVQVSNASTIPAKIYAGDTVSLTFDVRNTSGVGQVVDNLSVSAALNENYFKPIKISENVGTIRSESGKTVSLRFEVLANALPGSYRVPIMVDYDNRGIKNSYSQDLNFSVSSCSTLKVEGISLSSPTPHIGESLDVWAKIVNNCSSGARNVSVELKPVTNTTIAPFVVSSGSVKKLDTISPNSSKDVSFSLEITDKVDAKSYVFSIEASCDDCSKNNVNSFSFQVLGRPELVFSNIEYSVENAADKSSDKQILQGSILTFSVQLDNIGDEKAKAVQIEAVFDRGVSGTSRAFIGNINPDDSGAAVFNLNVAADTAVGEHKGRIVVSYIDELGKPMEFTQDYSLFVNAQPPTSPVVYIIILLLVIAVLAILYFIIQFIFRQLAIRRQSR